MQMWHGSRDRTHSVKAPNSGITLGGAAVRTHPLDVVRIVQPVALRGYRTAALLRAGTRDRAASTCTPGRSVSGVSPPVRDLVGGGRLREDVPTPRSLLTFRGVADAVALPPLSGRALPIPTAARWSVREFCHNACVRSVAVEFSCRNEQYRCLLIEDAKINVMQA